MPRPKRMKLRPGAVPTRSNDSEVRRIEHKLHVELLQGRRVALRVGQTALPVCPMDAQDLVTFITTPLWDPLAEDVPA